MLPPGALWSVPSAVPALAQGEVHVWRANLDEAGAHLRQLARHLGEGERSRAERFFFERDKHRFVARHGILRGILSGYLAVPADQVRFRYGRYGKPRLAGESGTRTLRFNLSYSDRIALLAFTYGRHVGVDVERIRAPIPCEDIAAQVLTRGEHRLLQRLPAPQRPKAFLLAWTCKEAYVKARGQGLSFPVSRIAMSLFPPVLKQVAEDADEASRWTLRELDMGDDYVAALAVEGHDWRLRCWEWRWH